MNFGLIILIFLFLLSLLQAINYKFIRPRKFEVLARKYNLSFSSGEIRGTINGHSLRIYDINAFGRRKTTFELDGNIDQKMSNVINPIIGSNKISSIEKWIQQVKNLGT